MFGFNVIEKTDKPEGKEDYGYGLEGGGRKVAAVAGDKEHTRLGKFNQFDKFVDEQHGIAVH